MAWIAEVLCANKCSKHVGKLSAVAESETFMSLSEAVQTKARGKGRDNLLFLVQLV